MHMYDFMSICKHTVTQISILFKNKKGSTNPSSFFEPKLTLNLERSSEEYIKASILLVSGPGFFVS